MIAYPYLVDLTKEAHPPEKGILCRTRYNNLSPDCGCCTQRLPQRETAMDLSHEEKELRDRFLRAMLEAALPLQASLEPEKTLQALIGAADMLKQRFEQELDELRQEAD